jgi:hypothetical protein
MKIVFRDKGELSPTHRKNIQGNRIGNVIHTPHRVYNAETSKPYFLCVFVDPVDCADIAGMLEQYFGSFLVLETEYNFKAHQAARHTSPMHLVVAEFFDLLNQEAEWTRKDLAAAWQNAIETSSKQYRLNTEDMFIRTAST